MKKSRLVFYIIFAVYHVSAFIFTLILPSILFSMVSYVPWFKYITLIGIILIGIDFVWSLRVKKEAEKENAVLSHELNVLKAKLFDLQEAAKNSSSNFKA